MFELDRGGRVRGRVVDAETGEPIDGAIVLSESDTPLSYLWSSLAQLPEKGATGLTTRADGAFDFLHLSAGIQQLRASKPGFAPVWSDPIPLAVGRDVSGVVLEDATWRRNPRNGALLDRRATPRDHGIRCHEHRPHECAGHGLAGEDQP